MKKQYIILAISIVILIISLFLFPIFGEILFIPFVYIFQYSCRSSNRRDATEQQIEQSSQIESNIPLQEKSSIDNGKNICPICGAKIPHNNLRFCESCGAKLT
jgi:hypothetical protein